MAISNSFSLFGMFDDHATSDPESLAAPNPLVSKLKVVDEKEGKDLKNKQKSNTEIHHAAKKRKGKGKAGNSLH